MNFLEKLNNASVEDAAQHFLQCCTSQAWVKGMVDARPFASKQSLSAAADQHWQGLAESDYLQAFEGHPKIGDVNSLKAKYANTKALAAGEQSGVDSASDETINALAEGNANYEQRFGFIFIVCASGKSAAEMLALLEARLGNSREQELVNAAREQQKIIHIRLEKM